MSLIKRIATRLPERWQNELKRIYYGRQIIKGTFKTSEPEYAILPDLINSGDCVIDIGANVGHYTKRFSELVGPSGRVIAFEPVPTTFALLAANVQLFAHANVTLLNAAASDKTEVVGISIPYLSTGVSNFYEAHLSPIDDDGACPILTLSVDNLGLSNRIVLIKIDAEGHEAFVLRGLQHLLEQHHPILIIETGSKEVISNLSTLGYVPEKMQNSPNYLFKAKV